MRYLENTALNHLSVLLERLDVGDRVIEGKLELFSTATKLQSEIQLNQIIDEKYTSPKWRSCCSPGGQLRRGDREIMINLISSMNQSFPDYDFSSLTPEDFLNVRDLEIVYDTINYNLSFLVEKILPGFVQDLWSAIEDAISLADSDIYSYETGSSADPYSDGNCLFSFHYFFHDRKRHRFLVLSSMTKSKAMGEQTDVDDDFVGGLFSEDRLRKHNDSFDEVESTSSSEYMSPSSVIL